MSNIHTLRDLETGPNNQDRYAFPRLSQQQQSVVFATEPRPKCIEIVFPGFQFKSFLFWISIVQTGIYIASVIMGSYGLTPTEHSLNQLGASYGPPVRAGQIWRFVTPLFLHGSFWHILFNVFFQLRMGFVLEHQYGLKRMTLIYFLCGIAGNALSIAWAPCKIAVGASTAGFGLIGLQLAQIALTWHLIQRKEEIIFNLVFFVMMTIFISITPHSVVDWRGHFGGFLAGFALAILYADSTMETSRPRWYKTGKSSAAIGLSALYAASIAVIYAIPMHDRGC